MHYYQAEILSAGLAAEIRLNDLPLYDNDGARGGGTLGGIVNDRVIDGHNTITVALRPAAGQSAPAPGSSLSVHLREVQPENRAAPAQVYAYQWKVEDPHAPLPSAQGAFESRTSFGLMSWQHAAPVALDAATEAGVRSLVQQLHDAMDAGDLARLTALLAVKARDQATATGIPLARFTADQEAYFRQKFEQPGWGMRPLDPAGFRFRLYGHGRVVGVKGAQGQEVLLSRPDPDGLVSGITVYASLLDGQWAITR